MPSLLLSKADPFDFAAVAKVLAAFNKIPFIDAVHAAKQGWGILAEEIPEEKALGLKAAFDAAGIETRVIPGRPATLPPVQEVASMKFEPPQVTCALRNASSVTITAADVALIAGCILDENRTVRVTKQEGPSTGQRLASGAILLTTGIPVRIGPKKKTVETKQNVSETFYYLDLCTSGTPRRLRVEGHQFDYSCLGAKKQYNIAANFKLLVKEWAALAPQARQSRGTHVLVHDKPISEMGYRSLEDLHRESRWLLSMSYPL